jgi:CBS domain containing-hemolysin-like protein
VEGTGRTWTRRIAVVVDEEERRALNARHGRKGMATITDTAEWIVGAGISEMEDVVYEYRNGQSRPDEDEDDAG